MFPKLVVSELHRTHALPETLPKRSSRDRSGQPTHLSGPRASEYPKPTWLTSVRDRFRDYSMAITLWGRLGLFRLVGLGISWKIIHTA